MKLFRVFISSVQSEFSAERRRLADYIRTDALLGRFFDVFLFEETSASGEDPQSLYLGEVADCDIYLGLVGASFGFETDSGKSATECEYDLAAQKRKTRLIFVRDVAKRDPREVAFLAKIQADVTRKSFSDFDSLRFAVYGSLVRYLEQSGYVRTTPFDSSFDTDMTLSDVDERKVESFLQRARAARKLTVPADADAKWLLEKLDALSKDGTISNTAVLLFGKDPQRKFLSSEVKCLQYWGTEIARPIPSYRILNGDLIQMIEDAISFVMDRIDHQVGEPARNGVAPGRDELPELAVREAIVNAVCHRDYEDNGSVQIMLFGDRLEIINPGTLPRGWTVERLLRTHDSKARNLTIAQALNWAGYVEKSGNGTEAIVKRCLESGLPMPEFHPDNVDFKIVIWRNPKRLVSLIGAQSGPSRGPVGVQSGPSQDSQKSLTQIQQREKSLTVGRDLCIRLLFGGNMSRKEISAELKVSGRSGYIKRMLSELVSDGLIELTLPDKPNSRFQQYRLTEKGKNYYYDSGKGIPTTATGHRDNVES